MTDNLLVSKAVLLKQADIFASLLDHELEVIAGNSEVLHYPADAPVFSEGDSGDLLYIVASGEVVIQKSDPTDGRACERKGRKTDIARFVRGDCFGELDLFTESARKVSALTVTDTSLLVFPGSGISFAAILEKHPNLAARILHKILVNIAGRIRRTNILIKENTPLIQELRRQVYRDKLTGIFNQTFLLETVRTMIDKRDSGFALLMVKPDNFKALNDTYGHEAGDSAIRVLAQSLRDFIGEDDRTARYKGNAMAVLLPNVDSEEAHSQATRIRTFVNALDLTEITEGQAFRLSVSIGITLFPDHGEDAEELAVKTHELPLVGRGRGGNRILFPEDAGEMG